MYAAKPSQRFVESPELLAPHDLPHPVAWEWVSGDGRRSSGANGASAHQYRGERPEHAEDVCCSKLRD